jgi:hypothetical protein
MQKFTLATCFTAALLLSAGVRADDQQSGQPQAQPASPADPIVCHTSMHEGFPRRDCFPQSRWDAMRRKGQEYLRNTQLRAQQSLVHMGPVHGH